MPVAEGGTVSGTGHIIRADGTKIDITLTSDPLTKEQAEHIQKMAEKPKE